MSQFTDYTFMLIILVVCLVALVPLIFFLLTLQRTLAAISPENRMMSPGKVWLWCIPLFNLVWQFIVVQKLSDSIMLECQRLNIPTSERRPTYNIGLAYCITTIAGGIIPIIGPLGAIVCWIMYWVKVSEYKRLIHANQHNFMLDAEQNVFHSNSL